MALLTPLNVNCHASDGRKVRAVTDFCTSGATSRAFYAFSLVFVFIFDLVLKESAEFWRFFSSFLLLVVKVVEEEIWRA